MTEQLQCVCSLWVCSFRSVRTTSTFLRGLQANAFERGGTVLTRARLGPVGSRRGTEPLMVSSGFSMGPSEHKSCTDMDSRAICRTLLGPIVPKQGSDENPSEPDLARWDLMSPIAMVTLVSG